MFNMKWEKEYFTESKMYHNALKLYSYEKTNMGCTNYFTETHLTEMKIRYYNFVKYNVSYTIERDWMTTIDPFSAEFFNSKEEFENKVWDGTLCRYLGITISKLNNSVNQVYNLKSCNLVYLLQIVQI